METLSTDVFSALLNALWWDLAVAAALLAPSVLIGVLLRPGVLAAVGGAGLALATSFVLRRSIRAVRGRLAGRLSVSRVA